MGELDNTWNKPEKILPEKSGPLNPYEIITKKRIELGLDPGVAFWAKEVKHKGEIVYEKGFYTVCLGFSENIDISEIIAWKELKD